MIKIIAVEDIALFGHELYTKQTSAQRHKTECIIKRYGQFKPLLIEYDPNDIPHLISGSGTLAALRHLGITHAYCFVFTGLSIFDSLAINMIDNQHRNVDVIRAAKTLELMGEKDDCDIKALSNLLNHTRDEIKNFKDLKEFNWDDYDNDPAHFQHSLF